MSVVILNALHRVTHSGSACMDQLAGSTHVAAWFAIQGLAALPTGTATACGTAPATWYCAGTNRARQPCAGDVYCLSNLQLLHVSHPPPASAIRGSPATTTPCSTAPPPSLQVRDEYRQDFDPGRGGYGRLIEMQLNQQHMEYAAGLEEEGEGEVEEDPAAAEQPRKRAKLDHVPEAALRPVAQKDDEGD